MKIEGQKKLSNIAVNMSFMYVWNVNLYGKIIAEEIAMVYENNSQRFEHNILCDFFKQSHLSQCLVDVQGDRLRIPRLKDKIRNC